MTAANNAFVHLHVHSAYSLLDGACPIPQLLEQVQALGQTSVAITDHGNLYAAAEFARAAEAAGIHPVIGCEVYVAQRTIRDREPQRDRKSHHLVLLCENQTGYRNLVQLVTAAHLEGFYYHPRVDWELLERYHEGLICLSACVAGEIPQKLLSGDYAAAKEAALRYERLFGKGNYYLEVQDHGIAEERRLLPLLRRLSQETGIPLVATNDVHYLKREDAKMQQVLLCIQTGTTVDDPDGLHFETEEFYLKSSEEMAQLFPAIPEALENTVRIAERCQVSFETGHLYLPKYRTTDGTDPDTLFERLCREGMHRRYGAAPSQEVKKRMAYEMQVIRQMGYVDYFLIVWDYIAFARKQGIPVGPGRGSGAGSICAYCLDITQIDPMKHQLLFERFLNPERVSMPDFDIDFCIEGRQAVKDYVAQRYGTEHVSEIITFDLMKARGAIRDAGRAMNVPYALCDRIARLVDPQRTLRQTLEAADSEEFRALYQSNADARRVIDMALRIEGMPRHTSTHAAGVIISAVPIQELVPLQYNEDTVVTQYTMTTLEWMGLLKFDFLGLRNLTVIRDCVQEIRNTQPDFCIEQIPVQDPEVYRMLSQGDTQGVFQFESAGMRRVLLQLQPQNLEDLTAVLSLYRPGPRDSIPKYIENRHHPERITYLHPLLEPILRVTNGCIVYQEQVMEICRKLAGYSYGRADLVRRAMAKKKQAVMDAERQVFLYGDGTAACCGAVQNGVPEQIANRIFDEIAGFASYAFNKSHAVAYAFLAYQTAYLKRHYFAEYMAALMTSVIGDTPKLLAYIGACEAGGIQILPPHINESGIGFTRSGKNIRFGLLAVRGLGKGLMEQVLAERAQNGAYRDLSEFCRRTASLEVSRRTLESLICCGALDGLGKNRRQMMVHHEAILNAQRSLHSEIAEGQLNLFGESDTAAGAADFIPPMEEYPLQELLRMEKEAAGMYLSGHPLSVYRLAEQLLHTTPLGAVAGEPGRYPEGMRILSIGIVRSCKRHQTRKGDAMCFFTIEDRSGAAMECIAFPSLYAVVRSRLDTDRIVYLSGKLTYKDEQPGVICESILDAEELQHKLSHSRLCCKVAASDTAAQQQILSIARQHPGTHALCFYLTDRGKTVVPRTHETISVEEAVLQQLADQIGAAQIGLV